MRPPAVPARARGRAWRRPLSIVLDVSVALIVVLYFAADWRVDRTAAIMDFALRPMGGPGQDWLLVGSRAVPSSAGTRRAARAGRTTGPSLDRLLLLHIPRRGGAPALIAMPPGALVPVPGRGNDTFARAFAAGGPRLLVTAVENATRIRVDRYLELPVGRGPAQGGALRPVRQLDFVAGLADTVAGPETLLDPLHGVPRALSLLTAMRLDQANHLHQLIRLGLAVRRLRAGAGVATSIPVGHAATVAGIGRVTVLDRERVLELARAIVRDRPVPAGLVTG